jgi:hypothetical protein
LTTEIYWRCRGCSDTIRIVQPDERVPMVMEQMLWAARRHAGTCPKAIAEPGRMVWPVALEVA